MAQSLGLTHLTAGSPYFATFHVIRSTPRLKRDYLEIMAVKAGRGRLRIITAGGEPRIHELRPGQMYLFRPVDEVQYVQSDPDGVSTVYVAFPVEDWLTFAALTGIDRSSMDADEPPRAESDPRDRAAFAPFERAIRRFQDAPTWLDLVEFWTSVVPVLFPHREPGGSRLGEPAWLTDAVRRMAEEPDLRGGVARLAELAHVSPSHLAATTRRYFDRTPTALVTDLRIRHAARLLTTTAEPITVIARRCGFGSLAYFSTVFRTRHGLAPREYRVQADGAVSRTDPDR